MRIAPGILISVTRIEINIASNTVCPLTVAGIEKLLHFGIGRLAPAWVTRNRKRVCTGSSRSSRQRSQTTVTVPSIVPSTSVSRPVFSTCTPTSSRAERISECSKLPKNALSAHQSNRVHPCVRPLTGITKGCKGNNFFSFVNPRCRYFFCVPAGRAESCADA